MELFQKSLARPVTIIGKGLHSGRIVRMSVLPAEANHGITFQRIDTDAPPVSANIENVSSTELSTTIGSGLQTVSTIEHIMAALHASGIDNAKIQLNGPEVPIMDGSAEPFFRRFQEAGVTPLNRHRKYYLIRKPFELKIGESIIRITPANQLSVRCSIHFQNSTIGFQTIDFDSNQENFVYVSSARTFCHIDDVQEMRRRGLALGGSLQNAVVVTNDGIANAEGLRGENEFVRHKLLDLLGDIYLLGGFLLGSITVHKPGHWLHAEFLRRLLQDKNAYSIISDGSLSSSEIGKAPSLEIPPMMSFI